MPANHRLVFQDWRYFLAFGFGSGLSPKAPGTMGTLVALPIFVVLASLPALYYAALLFILFGFGVWVCEVVSKEIGEGDYPGIVFDEIVGYLLTMFLVPHTWRWILLGFFLFRVFDIIKPWPIREADRHIHGGLGIMLDDVLAAVYAWIIIQLMLWLMGVHVRL